MSQGNRELQPAPSLSEEQAKEIWNNQEVWRKARRIVDNLQRRITKSIERKQFKKAKQLARLLIRSTSAKMLAIKTVTGNKGGQTPGVDKIKWDTPLKKLKAVKSLTIEDYKASPLKRVMIPKKKKGEYRPLGIPTMKDRAMQALYSLALDPILECTSDPHSYGFRKDRGVMDAIQQLSRCLYSMRLNKIGNRWVLEADIRGCFDNISHEWLIQNYPLDKGPLKQWLKSGFLFKKEIHETLAGTPQGGIISPLLANLTLNGLEESILKLDNKRKKWGLNVVRYADDFVITCKSKEFLKEMVIPTIDQFLKVRGLELSKEKTQITDKLRGFEFLGFKFKVLKNKQTKYGRIGRTEGIKYTLKVKPPENRLTRNLEAIRTTFRRYKTDNKGLVVSLNRQIRGVANYYAWVDSNKFYSKIGNYVNWKIRKHLKRMYFPKLNYSQIWRKHFGFNPRNKWQFSVETPESKRHKRIYLYNIWESKRPCGKYTSVKAQHNPYKICDRDDKVKQTKANATEWERKILRKTDGLCPLCKKPVDLSITEEHIHKPEIHHIIPLKEGGSNGLDNIVYVHHFCHQILSFNATALDGLKSGASRVR